MGCIPGASPLAASDGGAGRAAAGAVGRRRVAERFGRALFRDRCAFGDLRVFRDLLMSCPLHSNPFNL